MSNTWLTIQLEGEKEMSYDMSVYEYLQKKFGELPQIARMKELNDLPMASPCGDECGIMIDICVNYLLKLRGEYPHLMRKGSDFRMILERKITESAIETCLVYYLG